MSGPLDAGTGAAGSADDGLAEAIQHAMDGLLRESAAGAGRADEAFVARVLARLPDAAGPSTAPIVRRSAAGGQTASHRAGTSRHQPASSRSGSQPLSTRRQRRAPAPQPTRRVVLLVYAAAAGLAAVVGLGMWWLRPAADVGAYPTVAASAGTVQVRRDDVASDAEAGMVLVRADTVMVPPGGSLTLAYRDGTVLEFGGDAEFQTMGNDRKHPGKRIQLAKGRIKAEVATQRKTMTIATPKAEVDVGAGLRPNAFVLAERQDATALQMSEGTVQLKSRSGEKVKVEAGSGVRVDQSGKARSQAVDRSWLLPKALYHVSGLKRGWEIRQSAEQALAVSELPAISGDFSIELRFNALAGIGAAVTVEPALANGVFGLRVALGTQPEPEVFSEDQWYFATCRRSGGQWRIASYLNGIPTGTTTGSGIPKHLALTLAQVGIGRIESVTLRAWVPEEAQPVRAGAPLRINFQPAYAPVPEGYAVDCGEAFGARGNGRSYGWDRPNPQTRFRNLAISLDQRFDTLNHFRLERGRPGRAWEVAVEDGTYEVRVVSGDPFAIDSYHQLEVEGVIAVDGRPSRSLPWLEGRCRVQVRDGRLTVRCGPAADNAKICFIHITPIPGQHADAAP